MRLVSSPVSSSLRGRKRPRTTRGKSGQRPRSRLDRATGLEDHVGRLEDARGAPFADRALADPRLEVAAGILKAADAEHAAADVRAALGLDFALDAREFASVRALVDFG